MIPISRTNLEFEDSIEQYFTPDEAISENNNLRKPAFCITFSDSPESANLNNDAISDSWIPNQNPAFSINVTDLSESPHLSPFSYMGSNDFNPAVFQNSIENEFLDENVLNQYGYFSMSLNSLKDDATPRNDKIELLKIQAAEKEKGKIQVCCSILCF